MLALLLLTLSVATLAQFGVFAWRAGVLSTAAELLSPRIDQAALALHSSLTSNEFPVLTSLNQICPDLSKPAPGLSTLKAYYRVLQFIARFAKPVSIGFQCWANKELGTCTRCVAVIVDRRLERNSTWLAQLSSY